MKYRFMGKNREAHSVGKMAEVLRVSRSGYHSWSGRPESDRSRENRGLVEEIRRIQESKKYRYGSPRITRELWGQGRVVGENRVARLMRENGFGARPKRRFRVTTDSSHRQPVAENLLQRRFEVDGRDLAWVSDITYVATAEGWMYSGCGDGSVLAEDRGLEHELADEHRSGATRVHDGCSASASATWTDLSFRSRLAILQPDFRQGP